MRNRPPLLLIVMLAALLGFASAAAGFALPALAQNDGTVKIHAGAASGTDITTPDTSNETKVCTFHVHGISFTAGEQVQWWIDQQPPTGTANAVAKTTVTADQNGNWYTPVVDLANGHYKLYWKAITDQDLNAKHKVFQVQCGDPTVGTIAVTKYNDVSGDGHQQGNEPGLQGWVFNVTTGSTTVGSITTDADGLGLIDLAPGTYTVTEVAQNGWTNTEPGSGSYTGVAVSAGQTADLVFGNHQTPANGTIRIFKYSDLDSSGHRDNGEPGLADWGFTVKDGQAATVGTITTASDGSGSLSVAAGSYTIYENALPANWTNTDPTGATPSKPVTVIAGQQSDVIYFGNHYTPPAGSELRVFKYNDLDGDGSRDLPNGSAGEPGLAGWTFTVQLMVEGSPSGSPQSLTTGSDPLGYSGYLALAPGTYRVSENTPLPTGWTLTEPREVTYKTVTLTAEQSTTVIFGDHYTPPYVPETGTLQVGKYNDTDRDGQRDGSEPTLAGWTFQVAMGATPITTLTTDATGFASISLAPGTYTLTETMHTGWTSTDPGGATPTKTVVVSAGQLTGVLFGNAMTIIPPTTETQLVIQKYADTNANGIRDSGEGALSGFTFTVTSSDGNVVRTVVTGGDGTATILNLPLATYTITESARDGWTNTDPGGTATKTVTLSTSATSATVVFGNAQVRLPSTTTDGMEGVALTLVLMGGAALMFVMARRATRLS